MVCYLDHTSHKSARADSCGLGSNSQEPLQVRVWLVMRKVSHLMPQCQNKRASGGNSDEATQRGFMKYQQREKKKYDIRNAAKSTTGMLR